jgi:hypothetical protein
MNASNIIYLVKCIPRLLFFSKKQGVTPHITTDGRPKLSILTQAKLNIIKMERLV